MYLNNKNLMIGVIAILLAGSSLFFVSMCQAVDVNQLTTDVAIKGGYEAVTDTSLSQTAGSYIKIVLSLVGVIFMALTVYAGILWMIAGGEDEKVTKAKDILQAAVIGLIITVSAYSITYFVTSWLFDAQAGPVVVGDPYATQQ